MHLYQDFLSNLIAMDLLGNANNHTASADVITLKKWTRLISYVIFSVIVQVQNFLVLLTMLQLLLVAMLGRFDHLLLNNLSI